MISKVKSKLKCYFLVTSKPKSQEYLTHVQYALSSVSPSLELMQALDSKMGRTSTI